MASGSVPPANAGLFADEIADKLRRCAAEIFLQHPEARSLAMAIDYHGALNDAKIASGVWVERGNVAVQNPAAVFGSLMQTLKLLEMQFERALNQVTSLRADVESLMQEKLDHATRRSEDAPPAA